MFVIRQIKKLRSEFHCEAPMPSLRKNHENKPSFLTVKFTLNLWKHGRNKNIQLQKNDFSS